MVWARLDDEILDNPKIARAGVLGFALHVAAIAWCCRNLTDGKIPAARVACLLPFADVPSEAVGVAAANFRGGTVAVDDARLALAELGDLRAEPVARLLVEAGLWDPIPGGYEIHDFLVYNPSREKVLAERARGSERKQMSRLRLAPVSRLPRRGLASDSAGPVPDPLSDPSPSVKGEELRSSPPALIAVVPGNAVNDPDPTPVTKPTRRERKHRHPETLVPAGDAPAAEVGAWCERWKLPPPTDERVQLFLDVHRKKESRWRDWAAAWRTFLANERRWGAGPPGASRMRPDEPKPAPYHAPAKSALDVPLDGPAVTAEQMAELARGMP